VTRRPECGSGTVLAVGGVGALLLCLLGGLCVAGAVHAAHRARAAADLSALAAAAAVNAEASAATACARAGHVAAANGAVLRSCRGEPGGGVVVEVTAAVRTPLPALAPGPARARARAGVPP
jgi:secretion/DNA translocation related TadE-like protein